MAVLVAWGLSFEMGLSLMVNDLVVVRRWWLEFWTLVSSFGPGSNRSVRTKRCALVLYDVVVIVVVVMMMVMVMMMMMSGRT